MAYPRFRNMTIVLLLIFALLFSINYFHRDMQTNLKTGQLRIKYAIKDNASVDHGRFPELNREFSDARDVTEACLKS
ncbi:MAG: hypothetical protein KFF73_14440 [Cyclobacteriaceae bacterium]|nr:hypothetical protein [Cyclobacteriaceae bacterium]